MRQKKTLFFPRYNCFGTHVSISLKHQNKVNKAKKVLPEANSSSAIQFPE
jgi:hypothetical protein